MVHTSSNGARSSSLRSLLVASALAFAVLLLPATALADDAGAMVLAVEEDAGDDAAAGGGGVGLGVVAAIVLMGLAFRQVSSRD